MVTTEGSATKKVIMGSIAALSLALGGACGGGDLQTESLDSDALEMGVQGPDVGASWEAAPPELRAAFAAEYQSTHDERAVFAKYLPTLGAGAMLDHLELLNPRCHGAAHNLGKAIFTHTRDVGKALVLCGNRCTNACMHGAVGEAFGGMKYEEVTNRITEFCREGEMARLHRPGNCSHGLGHAIMIITGHDIPKSLAACAKFTDPGMDYYCATGVFMEYRGMLWEREATGKLIERPSLHYPCDTYDRYPAACYRYFLRRIRDELDAGNDRLVDECMKLESPRRSGCFHGLGAMYSRAVADEPSLLPQLCLHGNAEDQVLCIEGVIEKLADFSEERAHTVCATLKGKNATVCEAGAREKMYRLNKPTMHLYRPEVSP